MALKKQKKRNKPISWPPGRAHSRKVPIGLLLAPEERNTKLRGDWMERNIAYILVRTLPQVSGSSLQDIHHSPISLLFPNPKCRPDETQNPKRSEEHTSELQSRENLVCRLLLEKKKNKK